MPVTHSVRFGRSGDEAWCDDSCAYCGRFAKRVPLSLDRFRGGVVPNRQHGLEFAEARASAPSLAKRGADMRSAGGHNLIVPVA